MLVKIPLLFFVRAERGLRMYKGMGVRFADLNFYLIFLKYPLKMVIKNYHRIFKNGVESQPPLDPPLTSVMVDFACKTLTSVVYYIIYVTD